MKKHRFIKANLFYLAGRWLSKLYGRIFFLKRKTNFDPHIPKGPKVFVANHPNSLDPFYIMETIKEPVHMLIAESVFKIFGLGFLLNHAGHIKVRKETGRGAFKKSIALLKKGRSVLLFPEGGISLGNKNIGDIRNGAARMAFETKAPIIPLGIYLNPNKVNKKTVDIDKQAEEINWYRSGLYVVSVGKPIYFRNEQKSKIQLYKNSQIIREKIRELIKKSLITYLILSGKANLATINRRPY